MIQIKDKSLCCGCEACVQVCPKHCISFTQDHEGFFYPEVDPNFCIDCGLCEKICPVLHPYDEHKPQEVLAAINKDEEVRMQSSSGGVFSILATHIIEQGGVVFGVRFDDNWLPVFDCAETREALVAFRGSKYAQARVGNTYAHCKHLLDQGRPVLFSGTQCQIAGLLHFLRKPYSNLLAVDCICHGVPSAKVWQHYLREVVQAGRQAISDATFRNKRSGWNRFRFSIDYDEQRDRYSLSSLFTVNPFMRAFVKDLILRPSCYSCSAKCGRSKADITIADFWGIEKLIPQMNDDRGTSLVLIHTEKGKQALQREKLIIASVNYDDFLPFNPQYAIPASLNIKRKKFFADFNDDIDLHALISKNLRPSFKQRIKNAFYRYKHVAISIILSPTVRDNSDKKINMPTCDIKSLQIHSILFRSKAHSWKKYEMKIDLKKKDIMKIGIITLPLHTNYGGILQAYALQTVLERFGHKVVVYQKGGSLYKLPLWKYPLSFGKRLLKKILIDKHTEIFLEKKLEKDTRIIRQNTNSFINKYINTAYIESLSDINVNELDAIVVGSDQIWRPRYVKVTWGAKIQDAFLSFAKKWQGKRIAYAASFGADEWEFTESETNDCGKLIKFFDAVSVREAQGQKFCTEYFGVDSIQVLDPTLLLKAEDYYKLIKKDTINGNRKILFNYILDESEEISELLTQISTEKKLELYSLRIKNNNTNEAISERIVPPVESWLEGLYKADFVVTDSFHGCVFSIIFGKPFVALINNRRGASRFHSLFELLGLQDHLITDIHDYQPHYSYSTPLAAYDKLRILQDKSRCFLLNNLR